MESRSGCRERSSARPRYLFSLGGPATLYWKSGNVATTDGPNAETKEQLGGIHILEARDLNHVIQLISQHPGMKYGSIEIRPVADLSKIIKESEQRRRRKDTSR